ncbi:DELLA protein RGL1-like [Senna tora]|uniref:DELLA protein RGL1-like n=1 Tax=Senna tora TaxID=362788 RepID=A0A834WP73_9FABA|nr:DELLA protein RGL1-like [Senna tora]
MEDVNYDNLNHDFAIRRFGPARMEQEQGDQEATTATTKMMIPTDEEADELSSSDVDDFVYSFINMDHHGDDDDGYVDEIDQQGLVLVEGTSLSQRNDPKFESSLGEVPTFIIQQCLEQDCLHRSIPVKNQTNDEIVPITNMEEEEEELEIMKGCFGTKPELCMDQGLDLVHMLLACAEAVGCRDTQKAYFLLRKIWALANPCGDSIQRVSYCFASGLKCRLSLLPHNVFANSTLKTITTMDASLVTREKKLEAFQLLYQTTPYIAFGYMAANDAICEALQGKSSLHVIDLGMEHTLQWSSLIRALASRPEGSPRLRITGLINDDENEPRLRSCMSLLMEEASSFGIPLEFYIVSEPVTPSVLTKEKLNLREGEALFVNSILYLHKYVKESRGYLKAILQSIKKLCPTALIVVEQDSNHNGPFFLGRFLESVHYYSAIFDSLEASMPRNSPQRMKIERLHFAEEIHNIVAYEGPHRVERHESVDRWRRQLGRAGFHVMALKCTSQARMMLSIYDSEGYTLSCEKGCLLLGWKGRPIMMASAWQVARRKRKQNINHALIQCHRRKGNLFSFKIKRHLKIDLRNISKNRNPITGDYQQAKQVIMESEHISRMQLQDSVCEMKHKSNVLHARFISKTQIKRVGKQTVGEFVADSVTELGNQREGPTSKTGDSCVFCELVVAPASEHGRHWSIATCSCVEADSLSGQVSYGVRLIPISVEACLGKELQGGESQGSTMKVEDFAASNAYCGSHWAQGKHGTQTRSLPVSAAA